MVEQATLKLDSGDELRVEVEREDLKRDEIVVRRKGRTRRPPTRDIHQVIRELLADPNAKRHPAGTTDRLLAADRDRPY